MNLQDSFSRLQEEFDLKDGDFYFLDLIPLIEMIWADGVNQDGELKVLYHCVLEHIAALDQATESAVISVDEANSFLDRFAHEKPDPRLMQELMALFHCKPNIDHQSVMNNCLDIAAACTTHYPFGLQERVMRDEKRLLKSLFQAFNLVEGLQTSGS